jgi:hypothetical protein
MNSEKQVIIPKFPPVVKIGGIHYVSREGLERFKRVSEGRVNDEAKPAEQNQFVRITHAAAELGINPRTLLRIASAYPARREPR